MDSNFLNLKDPLHFFHAGALKDRGEIPRSKEKEIMERIYLARGEKVKARECGEKCKALIEETGYHRRDSEAEELNRR
ncbi:MAG: hypothetical protein ACYS1A_09435 [Planctomycetota bacterium]|jgi:hypothetical protein